MGTYGPPSVSSLLSENIFLWCGRAVRKGGKEGGWEGRKDGGKGRGHLGPIGRDGRTFLQGGGGSAVSAGKAGPWVLGDFSN